MAERRRRKRKQKEGWLSRYDFAYAGRSTANQAADHVRKIAPKLIDKSFNRLRDLAPQVISQSSRELDAIAARRINQLTRTTANEIQRIAPGIIRGAIEEAYKTPFRLLGRFGTNKYNQLKKKLYKTLRIRKKWRKRTSKCSSL